MVDSDGYYCNNSADCALLFYHVAGIEITAEAMHSTIFGRSFWLNYAAIIAFCNLRCYDRRDFLSESEV